MPNVGFDLSKCQSEEPGGFHVGTKDGNKYITKIELEEIGVTSGELFNVLIKLGLLAPLQGQP